MQEYTEFRTSNVKATEVMTTNGRKESAKQGRVVSSWQEIADILTTVAKYRHLYCYSNIQNKVDWDTYCLDTVDEAEATVMSKSLALGLEFGTSEAVSGRLDFSG